MHKLSASFRWKRQFKLVDQHRKSAAAVGARLATLALLLAAPLSAHAAIYMDFGDIPGEATKEPHVDWINVLSVSTGIHRPDTYFANREWADSTLQDIVVTKESDKSTPKLSESILTGTVHDKVVIDFATSTPGGPEPIYFQIELEKVRITSQSFSDSGGGSDSAETISLNPERIKWVYTELEDSEEKGKIEFAWDVIAGQPAAASGTPGDYNRDGNVDAADYARYRNGLEGMAGRLRQSIDDGAMNDALYNIWRANYGAGGGPPLGGSSVSAPEPCSVLLLCLGGLASLGRRRRG